jgi:hypothetical protein
VDFSLDRRSAREKLLAVWCDCAKHLNNGTVDHAEDHEGDLSVLSRSEAEGGGGVAVQTGIAPIEITIDRDFDSFSADEQARVMEAIRTLLGVSGDVRVISKKRGSVKLTLAVTPEQAEKLLRAINSGQLAELGVTAARPAPDALVGLLMSPPDERVGEAAGPVFPSTSAASPSRLASWPVPGYEVVRELGRGAVGVVYLAHHRQLDRPVAIKVILAGGHASADELARFRAEASLAAGVRHPHLVAVHNVGEHDGLPFCVMEFVEGGNLRQRLEQGPLPPREAALLAAQVAQAAQALHEASVVHRDIKPANVLLARDGSPRLADFGLAWWLGEDRHLTRTGQVLGTPSYMAPEQAVGSSAEVGPAVDVYALGAVLYELVTGRAPFRAATSLDTLHQVLNEEPAPPRLLNPAISRDLETVILKCLAKDPTQRYASAADLADDLERFLQCRPVAARPVGLLERAVKWWRGNPGIALLLMGMLMGMLGVAVALLLR